MARRMRLASLIAAGLILGTAGGLEAAPAPATSAPAAPKAFDPAVAGNVVRQLADALEQYFVFPETGKAYADMLRAKLARGGYSASPSAAAFADAVNSDLQRVHKDGHLELIAPGKSPYLNHPRPNFIEAAGWVAPDIAYIRFFAFPADPGTMQAVRQFLADHDRAKALIIDLRDHHGGGVAESDLFFGKMFAKPTPLLALDTRTAADEHQKMGFVHLATVKPADGPAGYVRRIHWAIPEGAATPLQHAKVYLLTSHQTVSAAEGFAFALKRTHRATLIGEVTKGADHFGQNLELPGGYEAFLPVGRSVDPKTGQEWEPGGVKPDVAVPADRALIVALEKCGLSKKEAALADAKERPYETAWPAAAPARKPTF